MKQQADSTNRRLGRSACCESKRTQHHLPERNERSEIEIRAPILLGGRSPPIHTYIHTPQIIIVFILKQN
nr:MAG TPA: hypothetical protein [Caudoviricetes sp.]